MVLCNVSLYLNLFQIGENPVPPFRSDSNTVSIILPLAKKNRQVLGVLCYRPVIHILHCSHVRSISLQHGYHNSQNFQRLAVDIHKRTQPLLLWVGRYFACHWWNPLGDASQVLCKPGTALQEQSKHVKPIMINELSMRRNCHYDNARLVLI